MTSNESKLTTVDALAASRRSNMCQMSADRADMKERKKVDCSMECTSKLIYIRDRNVHVSV
jgi:hypothetical protein